MSVMTSIIPKAPTAEQSIIEIHFDEIGQAKKLPLPSYASNDDMIYSPSDVKLDVVVRSQGTVKSLVISPPILRIRSELKYATNFMYQQMSLLSEIANRMRVLVNLPAKNDLRDVNDTENDKKNEEVSHLTKQKSQLLTVGKMNLTGVDEDKELVQGESNLLNISVDDEINKNVSSIINKPFGIRSNNSANFTASNSDRIYNYGPVEKLMMMNDAHMLNELRKYQHKLIAPSLDIKRTNFETGLVSRRGSVTESVVDFGDIARNSNLAISEVDAEYDFNRLSNISAMDGYDMFLPMTDTPPVVDGTTPDSVNPFYRPLTISNVYSAYDAHSREQKVMISRQKHKASPFDNLTAYANLTSTLGAHIQRPHQLQVEVLEAKDLMPFVNGKLEDVYCKVILKSHNRYTKSKNVSDDRSQPLLNEISDADKDQSLVFASEIQAIKKVEKNQLDPLKQFHTTYVYPQTLNPTWIGQKFFFDVPVIKSIEDIRQYSLRVTVKSKTFVQLDRFLGQTDIYFTGLKDEDEVEGWFPLQPESSSFNGISASVTTGAITGSIKLKLQW